METLRYIRGFISSTPEANIVMNYIPWKFYYLQLLNDYIDSSNLDGNPMYKEFTIRNN